MDIKWIQIMMTFLKRTQVKAMNQNSILMIMILIQRIHTKSGIMMMILLLRPQVIIAPHMKWI
ncbi:unnamed protein product [Brassica oleracea var. botrytis]